MCPKKTGNQLAQVDHIVVLMLENRSFDNMLGWLYDPGNAPPFDRVPRKQPFDGVSGKQLSNPIPPEAQTGWQKWIAVRKATSPTTPSLMPGEGYAHTNLELWNTILPPGATCPPFHPPYNLPDAAGSPSASSGEKPATVAPPMTGFVTDWYYKLRCDNARTTTADLAQIMACYTPKMLPVLSTLANQYAVCDRYFSSVPTQTMANRSFAFAATSSGIVDNEPYTNWLSNNAPTVCHLIDAARRPGLTWRIYFDPATILPLAWIVLPSLRGYLPANFSLMDRFYRDAAAGTLPSFSFIEPRMLFNHNDQHPPFSVIPGERLIRDVYQALAAGPGWTKTLFIITYDVHGGCYDHVPPPAAVPPDPAAPPGQYGFRFDRLGLRVPAVLISPYIRAGTVFRADRPLDHTSIIKTVTKRFGLPSLTARDAAAADFGDALTLSHPRSDRPVIPEPEPEMRSSSALNGRAVTPQQQTLLKLVAAHIGLHLPDVKTSAEANDILREIRRRYLRGPWS
ncbi:MAG: alkaline phosphatase family protein [Chloroflexota bacterium]